MKSIKFYCLIIILSVVLYLTSCNIINNNDTTSSISTKTTTSIVQVDNIEELVKKYKSETELFLKEQLLDKIVMYSTKKKYDQSDVIYAAWDLGNKSNTSLESVELQFTIKNGETTRKYYVNSAEFEAPINLNDIAESKDLDIAVKNVEIKTVTVRNFDAKEKQNDSTYLDKIYNDYESANSYIINKEYVKETFAEEFKVANVGELTTTYADETQKFLNSCYANYLVENAISVESVNEETIDWTLDELANATALSQVILTFTYTTETKEITKEVTFDLSDITLEQVAKYTENKEAVDTLIESAENTETIISEKNIQTATTIDELIAEYGDEINANLETVYKATLKKYKIIEDTVTNYRWDLGEPTSDNKIQNLKLFLERTSRTSTTFSFVNVMNVDLTTATSIDDLLNNTFDTTATYSSSYSYSYDNTKQNDRIDLINAILEVAVTDGFDYTNAKIILTRNTDSTSSTLGTINRFTVVVVTNEGIRQIDCSVSSASTDAGLITNIENGKYNVSYQEAANFSNNQLAPVYLKLETIEDYINAYGDEINANLEPLFLNALEEYYITEDAVTNYRWDLGEATSDNKIQNLKLLLEHTASSTSSYVRVMNITLNTPVTFEFLINNSITSATYQREYSYSYNSTKQNDRIDLINAILEVAVTDGFDYTNAKILYTENGQSTDSTLGTINRFTVVLVTDNGVRDMLIQIATASTDEGLINKIANKKYKVSEYNNVIDYENQLAPVYLTTK